ncbi:hydrolase 1, exosortase A system-associated [Chromatium okenii]|uniref:hydrolase 1, exosortase A system-associated n=1 Tax=Chromatium okenii TaxID=61644 RepID=UPI0026F0453F|nr:hydrolase 1, exosortase A system-associated [Chromatium okenii]MBV5308073.1 hydrolase 1, exosortase A system-associated [Chromatium okenii]
MNDHYSESPVVFNCEGQRLIGIIAQPHHQRIKIGVLIVVGGPQYRAGSHRQFTLLARDLAENGIASLRFDYRGMGDSEGNQHTFETVDADLQTAIDCLMQHRPELTSVIIWGLCDAASAALIYAHHDLRVSGLILLNPWVHTEEAAARVRLTQYYSKRLLQRSFWTKLFSGRFEFFSSSRDLLKSVRSIKNSIDNSDIKSVVSSPQTLTATNFIEKMCIGLQCFRGNVLFVLSGNDLTAQEFISLKERHRKWRVAFQKQNISQHIIPQANHTFSSNEWRNEVLNVSIQVILKENK